MLLANFLNFYIVIITLINGCVAFNHNDALAYLRRYHYLNTQSGYGGGGGAPSSSSDTKGALKRFQQMMGLPQTGNLDADTVKLMSSPRCGVSDFAGKRDKRYALAGSKWKMNKISYKVLNYPSSTYISQYTVDSVLEQAFSLWEKQTPLSFVKMASSENADIEVTFTRRDHDDGFPFDGKGGDLAHAFFPAFGGDIHFDDEEKWDSGQNPYGYRTGTNLLHVASHEIGHSLGLAHSDKADSIMYAVYKQKNALTLHSDDVIGIQMLYGMGRGDGRIVPPSRGNGGHHGGRLLTPPPPPGAARPTVQQNHWYWRQTTPNYWWNQGWNPPTQSYLCTDPRIDAITQIMEYGEENTYVFKGADYYMLDNKGIVRGYPKPISSRWSGIPVPVDAALYVAQNHKTFIFKDTQYWRLTDGKMDAGYPKGIEFYWPGSVTHIDAAFRWSGNGQTYFVKGRRYWRIGAQYDYPRPLSKWKGLPFEIDAAFQWKNGKTYFFSGTRYYRFNDYTFQVEADGGFANERYPRESSKWWFGCNQPAAIQHEDSKSPWCQVDHKGKVFCRNGSGVIRLELFLFFIPFQMCILCAELVSKL